MTDIEEIPTKAPVFSLEGKTFVARCVKVYDGDTITVIFKYSEKYYRWRIRLLRINAPELRKQTKQKGIIVRDTLRNLILNKIVKVKCGKFDAFGRILGEVYLDDLNISSELLSLGLVRHFGNQN
jgi:micrococcal nuclease